VAPASPAIFVAAVLEDGTLNSAGNPAGSGTVLSLYATGDGLEYGPNLTGWPATFPYPAPELPVTVTVAGVPATIAYAGGAPGLVGVFQVNLRVPPGAVPCGSAVLRLIVGDQAAPDLTVWMK
jgi:uncharacterized protein (TIGR03437 family)